MGCPSLNNFTLVPCEFAPRASIKGVRSTTTPPSCFRFPIRPDLVEGQIVSVILPSCRGQGSSDETGSIRRRAGELASGSIGFTMYRQRCQHREHSTQYRQGAPRRNHWNRLMSRRGRCRRRRDRRRARPGSGAEGAPATVHADVDGVAGMAVGAANEGMVRSTRCEPPCRKTVDGWASG